MREQKGLPEALGKRGKIKVDRMVEGSTGSDADGSEEKQSVAPSKQKSFSSHSNQQYYPLSKFFFIDHDLHPSKQTDPK